jgi:hypothetical protein
MLGELEGLFRDGHAVIFTEGPLIAVVNLLDLKRPFGEIKEKPMIYVICYRDEQDVSFIQKTDWDVATTLAPALMNNLSQKIAEKQNTVMLRKPA